MEEMRYSDLVDWKQINQILLALQECGEDIVNNWERM